MSRSDFSSVLRIIIEILGGQQAILVANQAIGSHPSRIEFNLDLHIFGNGHERRTNLFDQHLPCFQVGIDEGIVAVSLVGN